jgi:O-antigen/teichoic acid export membrane protein
MEPVVARQVVEAEGLPSIPPRAIFQGYFRASAVLGLLLASLVLLGREQIAAWLNVPVLAVSMTSAVLWLALLRPVVSGALQGQRRFIFFGLSRLAYAFTRLAVAVALIGLGWGLSGALAALPAGALLALACGLVFLGREAWAPAPNLPGPLLQKGLSLSGSAFVAYAAYTTLLSIDLIWVNRSFPADVAGGYAVAVLFRRALILLSGAVIVVMYPHAVARVSQGRSPDRLLIKTAAVVLGSILTLTIVFFALGPTLVRLTFGSAYVAAGGLLGWMGLAMLGYSLTSMWMNFYLATRPLPYVLLLALAAVLRIILLGSSHGSLFQVIAAFGLTGWLLALGGLLLYLLWLRPGLGIRRSAGIELRPPAADR